MNSKVYKWCAVPQCKNTSIKTPKKVFVHVPNKKIIRDTWLKLARRNPNDVVSNSPLYFCEDHFDLPNDMENYMEYHVMGTVSQVRMKPGCRPKKFICQPDRQMQTSDAADRPYITKKRKMILKKSKKHSSIVTNQSNSEEIESDSSGQSSVQLTKICYNHMIESSTQSQPTCTAMKDSPQGSAALAEYVESVALIYRVYNYLQREYEQLKSLNANNDCDLSPLSNILQRTAEVIGITPQMVSAVLNKKKLIKRRSQLITSQHNNIDNSIREGEHTTTEKNTEDYIHDFDRKEYNTKEIRIKEANTEDHIPDFKIIEDNSKEFIIKEENIEDYNADFEREEHNTEEISIKIENSTLYSTDFKIDEHNTEEFRTKKENIEDFGLKDDNTEDFKLAECNTEDDRMYDFAEANCSKHINEELVMKCEIFDDPLPLYGSYDDVTQHAGQTQVKLEPENPMHPTTGRKLDGEVSPLTLQVNYKKERQKRYREQNRERLKQREMERRKRIQSSQSRASPSTASSTNVLEVNNEEIFTALEKKREYQRKYRERNRDKLKQREAERRRRLQNA